MPNLSNIKVQHAIVHIIAHLKPEECIFSKNELPLQSNSPLRTYFEEQIHNVLSDDAIRQAIFDVNSKEKSKAPKYSIEILEDATAFTELSQKVAEEFLNSMGKDRRIRPEKSSIAVCLYTQSESSYLALLKLDPSEALIQKIEYDENHQPLWVNFEVRENAMPTSNERLQKAALILTKRSEDGHDLLLLDRQTSKDAADFFARKFLKATPLLSAIKHTELLYDSLYSTYTKFLSDSTLNTQQEEDFREHIGAIFKQNSIKVSEWIGTLNLPDDAKQVIYKNIRRALPVGEEFDLSPEYAATIVNPKRRIKGDYGFILDVEDDHWKDVVIEDTKRDIDGIPTRTLKIRITNHKESIRK